jgi:hypothetical protein
MKKMVMIAAGFDGDNEVFFPHGQSLVLVVFLAKD